MKTTLADLGEFGLIRSLAPIMHDTLGPNVVGAGDDCAAFPQADGSTLLVTTDTMIEERHFRWDYTTAFDLGWKLLAVNLSDIAAGGGAPFGAVITLQLRPELDPSVLEDIYRGIAELGKLHHVSIAGGDTDSSPLVALGATVFGRAMNPVRRSGAALGDDVWVSGTIGLGGLGLAVSRGEISRNELTDGGGPTLAKYCRPEPRLALGQLLSEKKVATSMIDISDGLIQDAGHLADRSKVKIEIDLRSVPIGTPVPPNWTVLRAVTAGDDYELLFTAPKEKREMLQKVSSSSASLPALTRIGSVIEADSAGVYLRSDERAAMPAAAVLKDAGLGASGGFEHFK